MGGGKKPEIAGVKASVFGRGLAVARLSVRSTAKAATYALGSLFADERTAGERRERFLAEQTEALVDELGRLKGSLMKAGQFLSMYGDYFVSPKLNRILKHLQADSPPVAWATMQGVLESELGPAAIASLDIAPTPLAAASLGQVYLARRRGEAGQLCLKLQYPGMERAIASDLASLKVLFKILRRGPHRDRFDAVLGEFRDVLARELNYRLERESLERFRAALAGDPRFRLPEPIAALSTGKVLTTTYMPGLAPDDPAVLALPQERRNALGEALLELYFREIFELGLVQTDPHFGNYKIQLGDGAPDGLVLLDFGSTRGFAPEFRDVYADYVVGAYEEDKARVVDAALRLGLLLPTDGEPVRRELFELAALFMEPLRYGDQSPAAQLRAAARLEEMPRLIAAKTRRLIDRLGVRPPPREIVLLDRKLMGIFVFLATLKALVPGGPLVDRYARARERRRKAAAT
jgi:predicted unusual protein kinase regulating ubiquinone biosynthesis (AarF/ABC1/UbiB family)